MVTTGRKDGMATGERRACSCQRYEVENSKPDNTPKYRVIGDMVYFKDIEKAVPLRKKPKDMKKELGIK